MHQRSKIDQFSKLTYFKKKIVSVGLYATINLFIWIQTVKYTSHTVWIICVSKCWKFKKKIFFFCFCFVFFNAAASLVCWFPWNYLNENDYKNATTSELLLWIFVRDQQQRTAAITTHNNRNRSNGNVSCVFAPHWLTSL